MVAAFESTAFESTAFELSLVGPTYGTPGYYPLTAAATRFRVGWGTWTDGYLCNEASGNLLPTFGADTLFPGGTLSYHNAGPLGGSDYAIKFDNTNDYATPSNNTTFDVGATEDVVFAWVAKMASLTGSQFTRICAKSTFGGGGGFFQLGYYAALNGLRWELGDAVGVTHFADAGSGSAMPGTWYAGLAVLDRARGVMRVGVRSLASDATVFLSPEVSTAGVKSLSNTGQFTLGGYSDASWQCAAFYVGKGVGVGAGVSANLKTELSNFADGLFPGVLTTYTTGDAIRNGSFQPVWVAAIEGYPYLLTSHKDPRKIVAAWNSNTAVDWQLALPNLEVKLDRQAVLNPWKPFDMGSDFQLRVTGETRAEYGALADQFGIDVAKRTAGAATQLTATVDRAAATLNVKATSSFASSGEVFIGTECIDATVATATTFTATKRGKYSPFPTALGTNFAEHHRVGTDALGVQLEPEVSQFPRDWAGKWVGIWLHWSDGTNVNPLSTAECIYAGKWQSYTDDGAATIVNVKSVLDGVANTVFGRDLFQAKVQAGFLIQAGQQITFTDYDYNSAHSWKTANPLVVVASGASGTNQINAGKVTIDTVATAINNWLQGEFLAGRVYGNYFFNQSENVNQNQNGSPDIRSVMHWQIPSTAQWGSWKMNLPWFTQFGWVQADIVKNPESSNAWHPYVSPNHPQANSLFGYGSSGISVSCTIEQASGHFADQYSKLPAAVKQCLPVNGGGLQWGCFMFNESTLFVGSFVDGTTEIDNMQQVDRAILGELTDISPLLGMTLTGGDSLPPIRQVFLLEDTFSDLLETLFYSTGTSGHNGSFDSLGYGLGLGIPGGLLGNGFDLSCDGLPGADTTLMVRIDQPTKFSDLLDGDLVLRRSFPKWKQGGLQIGSWYTPTVVQAIATLDETNKAEPSGNKSPQTAVTVEDTTYSKNVIKLNYNRDFSADEVYRSVLILEDRTAVDDAGGEGASVEIKARNSYGAVQQTGTDIESLWPGFMSSATMFTRPTSKVTRSISSTLFEDIGLGDTVLFSDLRARDPATGQRGVLLRPALITRHHVNYGGPGVPTVGEVELYFMPTDRIAAYAPAATVDSSINTSGFTAGYNASTRTLQTINHDFSEASESLDAASFAFNDDVVIVEIDPTNPASPLSWSRQITAVSGNQIQINTALTSPTFDATKTYRILPDHFGADQTSQKLASFQSSSTTGQLESSGAPYEYGVQPSTAFTVNTGNEQAELYSQLSYGDGKPRDTGFDRALVRTLNALIDYRSGKQAPSLSNTILENTTYSSGNGWQLAYLFPFFIGTERYPANVLRQLRVAPFFRSSTGASTSLRVTIAPSPTTSASKNDVTIPTPSNSVTFTTSSTTWGTAAEQDIPLTFRPTDGIIWVHVELKIHCQSRGLGQCKESKRS